MYWRHVRERASSSAALATLDSSFVETQARFAPAGGWFLYGSDETGQLEVYVDRFPERGAKRLVSTGGGGWPRWSRDGSEIFYLSRDNRLMVGVVQSTREKLEIGPARPCSRCVRVRRQGSMRIPTTSRWTVGGSW